jgi:hypothetical protein
MSSFSTVSYTLFPDFSILHIIVFLWNVICFRGYDIEPRSLCNKKHSYPAPRKETGADLATLFISPSCLAHIYSSLCFGLCEGPFSVEFLMSGIV